LKAILSGAECGPAEKERLSGVYWVGLKLLLGYWGCDGVEVMWGDIAGVEKEGEEGR
jgi:hypothetical protein